MSEINTSKADNDFYEFFKVLNKGFKKYGLKKIIQQIKLLSEDNDDYLNFIFKYAADVCCWYFEIDGNDFFANNKTGNLPKARKICLALVLKHKKDNSIKSIAMLFKRSRQVIYTWKDELDLYRRDNRYDEKNYFKDYDAVEEKFNLIIEQLNKN